jgi:hypothetical protein
MTSKRPFTPRGRSLLLWWWMSMQRFDFRGLTTDEGVTVELVGLRENTWRVPSRAPEPLDYGRPARRQPSGVAP